MDLGGWRGLEEGDSCCDFLGWGRGILGGRRISSVYYSGDKRGGGFEGRGRCRKSNG